MQISNNSLQNQIITSANFTGHAGFERLPFKYGITNRVVTETRLFRDYKSLKYCLGYLDEAFKGIEKNIVVGACSTGEDVFSLKMMLGEKTANIKAFDLGTETIEKAKSGIIEIDVPANEKSQKYVDHLNMDAYADKFLTHKKNITKNEMQLKQLFEENFEPIESKTKLIYKLKETLQKILVTNYVEFDKKFFRFKSSDIKCEFKSGNITEMESIIPFDKNQHLFLFKNAIYHIVTDNNYCERESIEPAKAKVILNKIFNNINKVLQRGGLFVMGELENLQHQSMHLVSKSLLDNGFLPIRMPDRPYLNIWKKVKETN